MFKKIIFPLILLFLVCSCVTTSVTKLNNSKNYKPVNPDSVNVYLSQEDIPCDFEKIALIKTKAGYALKDDKSISKARKKAGELGANGIVVNDLKDPSAGEKIANALFYTGASKDGEMIAIYVKNSDCKD